MGNSFFLMTQGGTKDSSYKYERSDTTEIRQKIEEFLLVENNLEKSVKELIPLFLNGKEPWWYDRRGKRVTKRYIKKIKERLSKTKKK